MADGNIGARLDENEGSSVNGKINGTEVVLLAMAVAVAVALGLIHATTSQKLPDSLQAAREYIARSGASAARVQGDLADVNAAITAWEQSGSKADLNQLGLLAQEAHDDLDKLRYTFATSPDSDLLGDYEVHAWDAVGGLQNAMGALVAYTDNPDPAALAIFNIQYQAAVVEWNQAVAEIWRWAGRLNPPTF